VDGSQFYEMLRAMAFTFCKLHKLKKILSCLFVFLVVVVMPSYGSDDTFFQLLFLDAVSNLTVGYTVPLTPIHINLF
jgi:hypothetical protein